MHYCHHRSHRLALVVVSATLVLVALLFGLAGLASAGPAAPNLLEVDLGITAFHWDPIINGATLEYQLYMINFGEAAAHNVSVAVVLPAGSTLHGSKLEGVTITPAQANGQNLTYNVGALGAYGSATLYLTVQLPNTLAPGQLVSFSGSINATEPDPDPSSNYSETVDEVEAPDMWISVSPANDTGPFQPGATITYTIDYTNQASYLPAPHVVITQRLPTGMSFVSARWDNGDSVVDVVPVTQSGVQSFHLKRTGEADEVVAGEWGYLNVVARLEDDLPAGTLLVYQAGVSTSVPELTLENNSAVDEQGVVATKPDLWVTLESATDGEVEGYHSYWLDLGNNGPLPAGSVVLTLTLPAQLGEISFSDPQPTLVVRPDGLVATWQLGTQDSWSYADGKYVSAVIKAAGSARASAEIAGTGGEANRADNRAEVTDEFVVMHMPVIIAPDSALIGSTPVFRGLGQPGATVELYLSDPAHFPGSLIGTALVDGGGEWTITTPAAAPIPAGAWRWFLARQTRGGRTSEYNGVGNYVSSNLGTDSNSLTVDSWPVGGIDQEVTWVRGMTQTVGARITRCEPLTPTLLARFYGDSGVMTGFRRTHASFPEPADPQLVSVDFLVPYEGAFELTFEYYCRVPTADEQPAGARKGPDGWTDIFNPDCWFGDCNNDKPDPPPPPKPGCKGCTPIPRPKPKPKPVDPDGLVYDLARVQSGASMEQSIVTNAWVSCERQVSSGVFEPWDAFEYSQVNPQFTDAVYPDKVLRSGYYSFVVPPGSYRIKATAPGFLGYESPILKVLSVPVTLHVPMRRPHMIAPLPKQGYLPALMR